MTSVAAVRRTLLGLAAVSLFSYSFSAAGWVNAPHAQDGIALPLNALVGDPLRGRVIVTNRQVGLCVLCHQVPQELGVPAVAQGNIAPSLAGVGSRWTPAQLRLRIVDSRQIDPGSTMPAYYRIDGLTRVGSQWKEKPILDAQQVEDVVAFLLSLK